jgi:hypothetical protein
MISFPYKSSHFFFYIHRHPLYIYRYQKTSIFITFIATLYTPWPATCKPLALFSKGRGDPLVKRELMPRPRMRASTVAEGLLAASLLF